MKKTAIHFFAIVMAGLTSGCENKDSQTVLFDTMRDFDNVEIATAMKGVSVSLVANLHQADSEAVQARVIVVNHSGMPIILESLNKVCELRVQNEGGWFVNPPTEGPAGLINDKQPRDSNIIVPPQKEVGTKLEVRAIVGNASEVYSAGRNRNSQVVTPKYETVPRGKYRIYANCTLNVRSPSSKIFYSGFFQSKSIDIVVGDS